MSESVTIKNIFRDDVVTKFGPSIRTTIKVAEYPDVRMSSFSKGLDAWKEGDKVMVDITKNGDYMNFKPGDSKTNLEARVEKLEKKVFGEDKEIVPEAQNDFDDFKSDE